MSKTSAKVTVGFTVRSMEHLPGGLDADEVAEKVREVVSAAVDGWYWMGDGQDLLALEPEVF